MTNEEIDSLESPESEQARYIAIQTRDSIFKIMQLATSSIPDRGLAFTSALFIVDELFCATICSILKEDAPLKTKIELMDDVLASFRKNALMKFKESEHDH